jgi:hypothetical protein
MKNSIIGKGLTLIGDNAYVRSMYMAVLFKGNITQLQDQYNFYQSWLRITIECTFDFLVHQWAILRGPLVFPLSKIPPLVSALCSLHNFCINERLSSTVDDVQEYVMHIMDKDAENVHQMAMASNTMNIYGAAPFNHSMIPLTSSGRPDSLLGGGGGGVINVLLIGRSSKMMKNTL